MHTFPEKRTRDANETTTVLPEHQQRIPLTYSEAEMATGDPMPDVPRARHARPLGGAGMIIQERTDRLRQAKELIDEIDGELRKRNAPKTVFEQMRKSALSDLRAELGELSELLGTTQHRLVFIGQVGVGKTTTICHLVGLTADREKRKSSKIGPDKTTQVTEDLMAMGSGFTTLCEVVVTPGDRNRFKIERKVSTTGTYAQIALTAANSVSFVDPTLSASTTYCYRVRAYNTDGNSGYSNEMCGTTR